MRVIIAGSRTITDYEIVKQAVKESGFNITEVISGTAKGVDLLGEQWAKENDIPIKRFKPDWNRWGKAAGAFRNGEMALYAEALVLVWDGESAGSANMRKTARMRLLPVYEKVFKGYDWF